MKLSPRRSSFQITIDVLTVIEKGEQRPTRIMYASNLSWNSLKSTLDLLVSKGYINQNCLDRNKKKYFITAKGREILGYYNQLESLVQVS
jgi:predicted transcriptional regulator